MKAALLIDFGSTYTKLRAVDLDSPRLLGSGQGPSTVTTDVTLGLTAALSPRGRHLSGLCVPRARKGIAPPEGSPFDSARLRLAARPRYARACTQRCRIF